MLYIDSADRFILDFESRYKTKVYRVVYSNLSNPNSALLMCRCGSEYISLPHLSQGIIETNPKQFDLKTLPKRWQIRDTVPHSDYIYGDKVNFELDLEDNTYNYTSNIRRKINKSREQGLVVRKGNSKELLDDFFIAYSRRMYEKGVPCIYKRDIKRGLLSDRTTLFIVYYNGVVIAGSTLNSITDDYYENGLFATISSYNYLYPSYLLHDEMINYAKHSGAKTYSFGRSTKNSSVYKYKLHYRAKEVPLYWSSSHKTRSVRNNTWFFKLWKLMPFRLCLLLGGLVHRRVY